MHKRSWKTTVGAMGAILLAIGVALGQFAGTRDASGSPIPQSEQAEARPEEAGAIERAGWINWPLVINTIGGALTAFGLVSARDDDVSSEGLTAAKARR